MAAARIIHLRRHCPICGGEGRAEAKLPGLGGTRPPVFDLDDLERLAARHSLGILLALVELLPYKQFTCARCGHSFRLANDAAKELVIDMIAAMQPVSSADLRAGRRPASVLPLHRSRRAQATRQPAPTPQLGTPAQADWEPEGLD